MNKPFVLNFLQDGKIYFIVQSQHYCWLFHIWILIGMEKIMIDTLLLAFGLVLIVEGVGPALFPNKWRSYLLKVTEQPAQDIRNIGFFILTLGATIIWISQ